MVVYVVFTDTKYDSKQVALVTLSRKYAYEKKEELNNDTTGYYMYAYIYTFVLEGEVDVS